MNNSQKIFIINYGMGNLRSVQKAFDRVGIDAKICDCYKELKNAQKLVLPGVGHFKKGIENLKILGFYDTLNELILGKSMPILGICLGMQLMTTYSEEGNCQGFGWVEAKTIKFSFDNNTLKIPHMGWNNLIIKKNNKLLTDINENDYFYFVHSFNIECKNSSDVVSTTFYGKEFVSVFNKDNIFGCQFHPEKSHDVGLKLLRNFCNL